MVTQNYTLESEIKVFEGHKEVVRIESDLKNADSLLLLLYESHCLVLARQQAELFLQAVEQVYQQSVDRPKPKPCGKYTQLRSLIVNGGQGNIRVSVAFNSEGEPSIKVTSCNADGSTDRASQIPLDMATHFMVALAQFLKGMRDRTEA